MVATSSPAPIVRCRAATFEDYNAISALEIRNGLPRKSIEEWRHLWIHNPASKFVDCDWPIGWVLERENGQIVGSFGNIPLLFELDRRILVAASGRSWVVDPTYRCYAALLLNYFLTQPNVDLFLNTTANLEASSAFCAFQASRVPVGQWDESIFWVTRYRGFAVSSLQAKSIPTPLLASYPVAAALALVDTFLGRNQHSYSSQTPISACSAFDSRFDVFWEQLRSSTSRLMSVRTFETLNWHFWYPLSRKELLILTIGRDQYIEAYAIFGRQDNERFGLRRMRLVDFQCLSGCEGGCFLPMLAFALRHCNKEGIHMLEVIGACPTLAATASTLHPYRRKLSSWRYLYKTNHPDLIETLTNPALWNPTCYDGDSSL